MTKKTDAELEAQAAKDFAANHNRDMRIAREIHEAYQRPTQEALELAKRAKEACERIAKMTPEEFKAYHAELEKAAVRQMRGGLH